MADRDMANRDKVNAESEVSALTTKVTELEVEKEAYKNEILRYVFTHCAYDCLYRANLLTLFHARMCSHY